jgi:hypothetical protein
MRIIHLSVEEEKRCPKRNERYDRFCIEFLNAKKQTKKNPHEIGSLLWHRNDAPKRTSAPGGLIEYRKELANHWCSSVKKIRLQFNQLRRFCQHLRTGISTRCAYDIISL